MIQEGQANPGFFNDDAAMKMTLEQGLHAGRGQRLDHCGVHSARAEQAAEQQTGHPMQGMSIWVR